MIGPIAHRGPDDSGVWADEQAGRRVRLPPARHHRPVAERAISRCGRRPAASSSSSTARSTTSPISGASWSRTVTRFRGHRTRRSILAAFEQWGIREAVRRFVGMFAIAVWDTHRRELSLVRDRLGKKPLYVYREPGLITFGSELKALLAGPSFDRSIDRDALASYLRYLYVPAPKSIFQHAVKVPPAHILTVSDARLPAAGIAERIGRCARRRSMGWRTRSGLRGGSGRRARGAAGRRGPGPDVSRTFRSARCSPAGSTRRPSWR